MKKKVYRKIRNSFKKLKMLSTEIRKDFGSEKIHEFRVKYKKLHALLRFIGSADSKKHRPSIPDIIKELYHSLGNIRSFEIQQDKLKPGNPDFPEPVLTNYLVEMKVRAAHEKIGAEALLKSNNFSRDIPHLRTRQPASTIRKKFADRHIRKLRALGPWEKQDDLSLHESRKLLKDIQYTWKYLKPSDTKPDLQIRISKPVISRLTDQLGEYHDLVLAIGLLDTTNSDLTNQEKDELSAVKEKWVLEKSRLLEEIKKSPAIY